MGITPSQRPIYDDHGNQIGTVDSGPTYSQMQEKQPERNTVIENGSPVPAKYICKICGKNHKGSCKERKKSKPKDKKKKRYSF